MTLLEVKKPLSPAMMVGTRTAPGGATNTSQGPDPATLVRSVRAVREHTHIQDQAEIWKPIPGWEGYYEVSDRGHVRSALRVAIRGNGAPQTIRPRVLKAFSTATLHLYVKLYRDGEGAPAGVHRLVMAAFVGPCPDGMEVCHSNGDPSDNRLSNLRYGTRSDNIRDSVMHGTNHWANKTHCPRGHELVDLNLVPSMIRRGSRTCLACSRAQSYIKHHPEKRCKMKEISDSYHAAILEEVSGE